MVDRKVHNPSNFTTLQFGSLESIEDVLTTADPRVGVIHVKTVTATYAVSHRSAVGRGVQIAKGVVTGDTPDVNRVREITKDEVAECEWAPNNYIQSNSPIGLDQT